MANLWALNMSTFQGLTIAKNSSAYNFDYSIVIRFNNRSQR